MYEKWGKMTRAFSVKLRSLTDSNPASGLYNSDRDSHFTKDNCHVITKSKHWPSQKATELGDQDGWNRPSQSFNIS